jgi:hypothetical protein
MLCRFVFAFWWSVFVICIWTHIRQPLHVWTVDRHSTQIVQVKKTIQPIAFKNVSVIWTDMVTDAIHLELVQTISNTIGVVSIMSAKMSVFEDSFRDKVIETYDIAIQNVSVKSAYLDLLQDDIHLSPFRRIEIVPNIEWSFGSDKIPDFERSGHFKDGKWYEGQDSTQLGFGALFAWCMGVVFLVVMRRPNVQATVVVKRKKRIFKQQIIS